VYRAANREKATTYNATYRAANREKAAAYYVANREKHDASVAAWRRANRASIVAYTHRWRARRAGNGGSYTAAEWRDKCALLGNLCIYCGRDDLPLTVDHKVPLSRGGTNYIENLAPACGSCNSRKHNRTAEEFLAVPA